MPSWGGAILAEVADPTDSERVGAYPAPSSDEAPTTLGDLKTPLRMSRVGWLIAAMLFIAVLSFFIVVVCLGVDNS